MVHGAKDHSEREACMKIYFTARQFPELASLPKSRFRTVYTATVTPVWRTHSTLLVLLTAIFAGIGALVGAYAHIGRWGIILGAILGSQLGIQFFIQFVYERARPDIRRYLEEHDDRPQWTQSKKLETTPDGRRNPASRAGWSISNPMMRLRFSSIA